MEKITKVKLTDLKLAENNVRMHPRRQIEEYKRSLKMFGQTKNAVIDEDNTVLIGNGLVMAARELEWEDIYAICRSDLSENDKLKLMVSDNKIFGLGIDNLDTIDEIFSKLVGDMDIPGYDEATLNLMIAQTSAISEEIASYGVLLEEQVEEIQNRQTHNPLHMQTDEQQTAESNIQTIVTNPLPQIRSQEQHDNHIDDNTEMVMAANCPNCRRELWLSRDALLALMS